MVLELGPCPADVAQRWSKFARRIIVELRAAPDGDELISADVVDLWSKTLSQWTDTAQLALANEQPFRWSAELEPEVAEFLLHGLDQCLHSPVVMSWVTPAEAEEQRVFTMAVVRSFVDGLTAESNSCQHYADQILTSLGSLLADS